MEAKELSPGKFAVNYGLILGLIMVIISVGMYTSGMMLEGKQWPIYIYYLIFPLFIIYTISQYRKSNGQILSLSDALKVGVATGVISGLIYAVYSIIFNYVIDPEFMGKMMEVAREKLYENPKMTEEMIDKSMEYVEKFSNPLLGSAIWIGMSTLFGLIYALVGGLILKKEA
ncbi:DUF4199 domain-containing protein [Hyunsoonleella sp. SJ7]|uniref:DUF4199 domain-containing protein n=1 Tax=Hyunsoonleella aquatilis TaxID=2762758 RepID=A0A923KJQ2_9FLAO|nr:DUF4199 domain-containing protein [Hyunsoonleella aquatilis]MBC3757657.1 DUF4199 domain-containing protein [Hyunsoonleella aquatilis]